MEKKRKGLFGRLLDFWKEKIGVGETDSIGFWNDTENIENHFAELGAVASLTQEDVKQTFWEETVEAIKKPMQEEQKRSAAERKVFFVPVEELQQDARDETESEMDLAEKKRRRTKMFATKGFRSGGWETEEEKESELGKAFLWEMPEVEGQTLRGIIPVAEELTEEKVSEVKEEQEMRKIELSERVEKQEEPTIDIEKLMRQITKKLWEDRESCGRRLR